MEEFRLANDRENYSKSYALHRENVIKSNFTLIAWVLVVIVVLFFVWDKFGKKIIANIKEKKNGGDING